MLIPIGNPPKHTGRSPEQICREHLYFDSAGYLFRAVSWLEHYRREQYFPSLLYACIEGRMAIEYLLFEILVIGTGANLSVSDYQKCLKDRTKLDKAIGRLIPDYERIQAFTAVLVEFEPSLPRMLHWDIKELKRMWGELSEHLHWLGAKNLTVENTTWCNAAYTKVESVLHPLWSKLSSGQSMVMHPDKMNPEINEVWVQFNSGKIDIESVRLRLQILKPLLNLKYSG
jgi:hypothetical protein